MLFAFYNGITITALTIALTKYRKHYVACVVIYQNDSALKTYRARTKWRNWTELNDQGLVFDELHYSMRRLTASVSMWLRSHTRQPMTNGLALLGRSSRTKPYQFRSVTSLCTCVFCLQSWHCVVKRDVPRLRRHPRLACARISSGYHADSCYRDQAVNSYLYYRLPIITGPATLIVACSVWTVSLYGYTLDTGSINIAWIRSRKFAVRSAKRKPILQTTLSSQSFLEESDCLCRWHLTCSRATFMIQPAPLHLMTLVAFL